MIEHQLLTFASTCLISLDRLGFTISVTEDLDGWQARMIEIGKPSNHPMMSPQWHDFAHPEAFGVQLSANGNLVGGVAARYHDLGQETLGQYWGRSYKRLYGNGADIPVHSPARKAATEVTGKVVYLGELFVTPDFRSTGGAALVMNYLFLLCAIRWKPSWIYGFIRQKDVLSGKPLQYGFSCIYPGAQTWINPPRERSTGEYLALLQSQELYDNVTFFNRHPEWFGARVPLNT
jgi:GNAT superfamily N-acetyltransferase